MIEIAPKLGLLTREKPPSRTRAAQRPPVTIPARETGETRQVDSGGPPPNRDATRLGAVVAGAPVVLFEFDREGRYTLSEGHGLAALGRSPGEVVGQSVFEVHAGNPEILDVVRQALAGEPVQQLVIVAGRALDVSFTPTLDETGAVTRVIGVAYDVTELHRCAEALRESEGRFRSLVTNMRGIIFCRGVAGGDDRGGGAELYGVDVAGLAGTRDPQSKALIDGWYQAVHPEDRPAYAAAKRRRKERHEPYALDYRITHPETGEPRWVREVAWAVEDGETGRTYLDSYIVDITDAKRSEQVLRDSEARHRRLIEEAPVAILTYLEERCAYANPGALRLLGAAGPRDVQGRRLADLADGPGPRRQLLGWADSLLGGCGEPRSQELRCRRLDGRAIVVEARMAAVVEAGMPALQLVLVDIGERKRAEARAHHLAHHDALTGLPNRLLLLDRLGQAVAAAGRDGAGQVALLILDLDGFKEVNDTLGHAAGDDLLRQVARRLREVVRGTDTLARLGGDEFAVVQAGLPSPRAASDLAGRLVDAVARPFLLDDGQEVAAGASVGISLFPADVAAGAGAGGEADAGGLMRNADLALYRAKDAGRGRFCFFEPAMNEAAQARRRLAVDLRAALERGGDELALVFQPLVDLESRAPVGAEALLRWPRRPGGAVPPAEFVPVAESTGLIRPLGAWVLERACAEAAALARAGTPVQVAVNVSAAQLRDGRFGGLVKEALDRHGLPPELLCLELTESLLVDPRRDGTDLILDWLARLGVRLAIDDFGTGFSSLANLRRLPVHHIKIDRSFVRGLGRDPESEAIVRATVRLAHELGKLAVAEGVEAVAQHRILRRLGCDRAQGYLYGRPQPVEALLPLLARRRRRHRPPPSPGSA